VCVELGVFCEEEVVARAEQVFDGGTRGAVSIAIGDVVQRQGGDLAAAPSCVPGDECRLEAHAFGLQRLLDGARRVRCSEVRRLDWPGCCRR
jgi:hypothetical protein